MTHAPSHNTKVSIIIPVYNEGNILAHSIKHLHSFLVQTKFPYTYTIIVVDNASTDNTKEIGEKLVKEIPHYIYIFLDKKGKGRAIRRGWQEDATVLTFMDVDLASDLTYFKSLVEEVVTHKVHLAMGNRLGKTSVIVGRKFVRNICSRIYNRLVRTLFFTGIEDHQCGFKAIDAGTYRSFEHEMSSSGWFFDTELIVRAKARGLTHRAIDIKWFDNTSSKVSLFKTSYEIFKALIHLRLNIR